MNGMRNRWLAICLLLFGMLALAACGGDDDDSDGSGNGAEEATVTAGPGGESSPDAADETPDTADPTEAAGDGDDEDDDDGGDGGSVEASDACAVVTQAQVEAAFGGISMPDPESMALPDTPSPGGGTATTGSCAFVSQTTPDSFSLTIYSANDDGAQALVDLACENKDSVSVGDEACWYSEAHTQIQMKAGPNFVDLFVTTVDGDTTQITSTLAEQAAEQLR
jgi:hypothetical protein